MGVTLILTLDSLSPFAEGNDVPRQRHRPFVGLAQQRPGASKALTLTQRPQGENRLPPSCTPAHPRPFQALAHQGFTRGFHDPRANRQVLRSQGRIAHPVAMLTKIGQRFMDSLPTRVARPQATQRPITVSTPSGASRSTSLNVSTRSWYVGVPHHRPPPARRRDAPQHDRNRGPPRQTAASRPDNSSYPALHRPL